MKPLKNYSREWKSESWSRWNLHSQVEGQRLVFLIYFEQTVMPMLALLSDFQKWKIKCWQRQQSPCVALRNKTQFEFKWKITSSVKWKDALVPSGVMIKGLLKPRWGTGWVKQISKQTGETPGRTGLRRIPMIPSQKATKLVLNH
jgi:hypothetical protein